MSKEKYVGRNYEELRNIKISDMTGAELEHLNKRNTTKKPGTFGLFIAGAIEGGARAIRERKENILRLGEERMEKNATEEAKEELVEEFRKKLNNI